MPLESLTQLSNISASLSELRRMYQLNAELMEQLSVTLSFLRQNNIRLPNQDTFDSLLNKTAALLDEIQADEPKILQYNVSRRKVTDFDNSQRGNRTLITACSLVFKPLKSKNVKLQLEL